jgi:hypothetical protein
LASSWMADSASGYAKIISLSASLRSLKVSRRVGVSAFSESRGMSFPSLMSRHFCAEGARRLRALRPGLGTLATARR